MSASEAITPSYQANCTRRISNHRSHIVDAVRALTTDNRLRGRFITTIAFPGHKEEVQQSANELALPTYFLETSRLGIEDNQIAVTSDVVMVTNMIWPRKVDHK